MAKQRGKIGKYSKITLQKKYQLLKMTEFGKNNLRDTSKHLQINYSTAKTICFQFQNHKISHKLKFFKENNPMDNLKKNLTKISQTATYKSRAFPEPKFKQIEVVCSSKLSKSSKTQYQANGQSVAVSTLSAKCQKNCPESQKAQIPDSMIEKDKVFQPEFGGKIQISLPENSKTLFQKNRNELEWNAWNLNEEEIKSQKIYEPSSLVPIGPLMYYYPINQYSYGFFIN